MMWRRGIEVRGTGSATSGPGGVSISGYHSGPITVHTPGREPVPWPHKVGVIPRAAEAFQDRAEAKQLQNALANSSAAVLCQVVRGTGGVGKTQLAAHYARTAWQAGELDVLVWINASSRSAIISAYAQAAEELLAVESGDAERAAERFLAWLDDPREDLVCRWLVVLDDVVDPAALTQLYPPESPHGRTLVTTRRRDGALPGRQINLGMFTPEQATAYFTEFLARHGRQEDTNQIRALAEDLGYLPLALSQAVTYLIDAGLNCQAYRELLADRTARLEDLEPDALPDDQPHAVHAAWSLSIERANQLRPYGMAEPVLQLAAMLDPNGIPAPVLLSKPTLLYLTQYRQIMCGQRGEEVTTEDALRALRTLHKLSLIDHDTTGLHHAVRIHQVIQRSTRDALPPPDRDFLAVVAATALIAAWPETEHDTELAQALRANTRALINHAEDSLYRLEFGIHGVLFRLGLSLQASGQPYAAISHFRRLASTAHTRLGPDHPDTLGARSNLANLRGEAGDPAGAVTALAELLTDQERLLGANNLETLLTRRDLAHYRGEAGDAAGAAKALAELVPDTQRALGAAHPETVATRSTLAYWRGRAGNAAGAVQDLAELLDDALQTLGPNHPFTLKVRGNLASFLGKTGDMTGSVSALAELLADRERVLGPDHPETLDTRNNLAFSRGEAGDPAGAVTALAELLADRERVQGPDHPDTLSNRFVLAHWRGEAGDATGAAEALAQLLPDRERVQGPDHPDTLATRRILAHWRGEAGDATGAARALAQLLADEERLLGPDHPMTLATRNILAAWKERASNSTEQQSTD